MEGIFKFGVRRTMREILKNGAAALGVELTEAALRDFEKYYGLLTEKNRVMNLTAISGREDAARLHFLDCLGLFGISDFKNASVIDVGSGAGFPGLPLKICENSIALTLLDALKKRVDFLEELCGSLSCGEAHCIHGRAEELALAPEYRDSFDFAVSRAVARLSLLCELCMPFVRPGGYFIAMKSAGSAEETSQAENAVQLLGGRLERIFDYPIPGTDITHRAVVIKKISNTPKKYPRRFAKMQKDPL